MIEYIKLWVAKAVAELALGLIVLIAVMLVMGLFGLRTWLKQRRCSHPRYNEDRSCTAWCGVCGKNLGFVGKWREHLKTRDGA